MDDFDPDKDRLREVRKAETLARLRAAAPGAAEKLAAAVQAEPDPAAIHRGILKRNFPSLPFIHRGWPVGLPSLVDLANLAALRAHFSKKKQPAPPRPAPDAKHAEAFAAFAKRFGPRRSIWNRLVFWRR